MMEPTPEELAKLELEERQTHGEMLQAIRDFEAEASKNNDKWQFIYTDRGRPTPENRMARHVLRREAIARGFHTVHFFYEEKVAITRERIWADLQKLVDGLGTETLIADGDDLLRRFPQVAVPTEREECEPLPLPGRPKHLTRKAQWKQETYGRPRK